LNDSYNTLQWIVRKSKVLDHRSVPEFLGLKSSSAALIYSKDEFEAIEHDPDLKVDAIIDFSSDRSIYEYGQYAAENGITIVTAVSRYGVQEIEYIKRLAVQTRVLWSPNITIGINFLIIAAKVLQKIAPDADIEILEEHFKNKREVSGTAKVIAKHLNQDAVNIKTVRAGGIVGKHEIIFGFPYQVVRLTHESISREAFGNGALFALQNIKDRPAGFYTMEDIIKPYFDV